MFETELPFGLGGVNFDGSKGGVLFGADEKPLPHVVHRTIYLLGST